MSKNIISNKEESTRFKTLLESYWMDLSSSPLFSEEINKYYKVDTNLQFIDNTSNNNKAATLAMSCSDYELFEFLLTSDKIKNKKYSLNYISLTLEKNKYINEDFVFLLMDCVENKKEIFEEYKPKIKKVFIRSCLEFFISKGDLMDKEDNFLYKNNDLFFNILKKLKVNPYEEKYPVVELLINNSRIKTLDYLIDVAKKEKDKEKVLYFEHPDAPIDVSDFFSIKRKTHERYKEYQKLKNSLSTEDKSKFKKTKI